MRVLTDHEIWLGQDGVAYTASAAPNRAQLLVNGEDQLIPPPFTHIKFVETPPDEGTSAAIGDWEIDVSVSPPDVYQYCGTFPVADDTFECWVLIANIVLGV